MSGAEKEQIASSFRDLSGFVYTEKGMLYRQVNPSYSKDYDHLIESGLYQVLVTKGLLIPHTDVTKEHPKSAAYKILKPDVIPFISYPYEWCFSQLKDAALCTLAIQLIALEHGMSLKDASAYNIQFLHGKPIFIDTLSFELYKPGSPWIAYRQFCQHFLAPLALVSKVDVRLGTLSTNHIDGIPLELAASLLPHRTKFSLGLGTHLHLHARSQTSHAETPTHTKKYDLPKVRLIGLLQNLQATTKSLTFPKQKTTWDTYYTNTNYTSKAASQKEMIVNNWITNTSPKSVWDAGANDGTYSRIASDKGIFTVAADIDPVAVEYGYLTQKKRPEPELLHLILDVTNPSPAIGWSNTERMSFLERGNFDTTLCLALIHHLTITNNLPFEYTAKLFAEHTKNLIIEFVPKGDSKVEQLLAAREDIFPHYTQEDFESSYSNYFTIIGREKVSGSMRTLYHMKKK